MFDAEPERNGSESQAETQLLSILDGEGEERREGIAGGGEWLDTTQCRVQDTLPRRRMMSSITGLQ